MLIFSCWLMIIKSFIKYCSLCIKKNDFLVLTSQNLNFSSVKIKLRNFTCEYCKCFDITVEQILTDLLILNFSLIHFLTFIYAFTASISWLQTNNDNCKRQCSDFLLSQVDSMLQDN